MGIRMMAAGKNDARALPREILSGHIIYRAAPLNYSNWRAREVMSLGQMRRRAAKTDRPKSVRRGLMVVESARARAKSIIGGAKFRKRAERRK